MGDFVNPDAPNITDFLTFLNGTVQIPVQALPSGSQYPGWALTQAIGLVVIPASGLGMIPGAMYCLACYNCATHILFSIAPDQPGNDYFSKARSKEKFGIDLPWTGLVAASSDATSSTTLAVPVWASKIMVGQLAFYRTPWGRYYLNWQQSQGPNVWGLS